MSAATLHPQDGYLAVSSLRKRFGDTEVVRGIDLHADKGEAIVILGPSGCGKSTTLRMIAGLERPNSGSIHLNGRLLADATTSVRPERRNMSVVFQSYALWPHLTVYQHVAFGPSLRRRRHEGDVEATVRRAIRAVQLEGYEDRYPDQLSGGQQQRTALARAIAINPDLLLLDEPLSNLDASLREEMRAQIRVLHRNLGVTMLYVTHDQAEALSIADRIVVMRAGVIEQTGTALELFSAPRTEYVAKALGPCNFLPADVVEHGAGTVVRVEGGGVLRLDRADGRAAVGSRVTLAVRPASLTPHADLDGPCIKATVEEVLFYGENTTFMARTAAGTPLKLVAPGHPAHERGDVVGVSVDVTAVSVLPAEPTTSAQEAQQQ